MGKTDSTFASSGAEKEGDVEVDISYDIIQQFSRQLYTNPRKAIEELVTNSYDAGASDCWVKLPKTSKDNLLILDNGQSMDLSGIKDLWHVAVSPKYVSEDKPRIDNDRMQIGKFGVGKLAAFALGNRLTHITCVKDQVRVISVGQTEIKTKKSGKAPTFPVYKIPLQKVKQIIEKILEDLPRPWDLGWHTWTLAIVEEIDPRSMGRALKVGFLKRMITTSLPISAAFRIYLEGEPVPKREIKPGEIAVTVDVISTEFRKKLEEALQNFWQSVREEKNIEDVPAALYKLKVEPIPKSDDVSNTVRALLVPILGHVSGNAVITKTTLATDKLIERGYSNNGFAIYVHGKLINPEDELFGITQRSHRYWNRFLARVEMPGLDRVLLVQRNSVSENSDEAQVARVVLRTLFNHARNLAEASEEETEGYTPASFGSRLTVLSPILGPMALRGLAKDSFPEEGLKALAIEFATLGIDGSAARWDPENKRILINEDHPLIEALDETGSKSKPLRHMIGEVIAGTEMSKGYLTARGVKKEIVQEAGEIVEDALRSAAGFVRDEVEEHIQAIEDASYEGGRLFEKAVVTAFRSLRLAARHMGAADEADGIIEIPISGKPNLKISVEAKGSKGVITHKDLSEATVTRHMREAGDEGGGCDCAIAIAREFATDGKSGRDSALIRETKGKVTLITVDAIAKILRLHKKRPFTYDKIAKILTTWKHPDKIVAFVEETWREMPPLGLMKDILQVAYEQVQKDSKNFVEPGMILGDDRIRRRKIERDQIIHILEAIQSTTGMIIIRDQKYHAFELLQAPETILEAMQHSGDENNNEPQKQK